MSDPLAPRRWDPLVKLTHWSIVIAILANALVTGEGSSAHVWVGYGLLGILALRLFWGLVGPVEARFTSVPPSPRKALAHISEMTAGKVPDHKSHNPLGALMVYAIWGTLLVVIASGVSMSGLPTASHQPGSEAAISTTVEAEEGRYDDHEAEERHDDGDEEAGEEVHEAAVNLLYALILLHMAGVIFESRRQKRNLALAMLPGHR